MRNEKKIAKTKNKPYFSRKKMEQRIINNLNLTKGVKRL